MASWELNTRMFDEAYLISKFHQSSDMRHVVGGPERLLRCSFLILKQNDMIVKVFKNTFFCGINF